MLRIERQERTMNFEQEISSASREAIEIEKALLAQGFSKEHWALIKRYIGASIKVYDAQLAKAVQDGKGRR